MGLVSGIGEWDWGMGLVGGWEGMGWVVASERTRKSVRRVAHPAFGRPPSLQLVASGPSGSGQGTLILAFSRAFAPCMHGWTPCPACLQAPSRGEFTSEPRISPSAPRTQRTHDTQIGKQLRNHQPCMSLFVLRDIDHGDTTINDIRRLGRGASGPIPLMRARDK